MEKREEREGGKKEDREVKESGEKGREGGGRKERKKAGGEEGWWEGKGMDGWVERGKNKVKAGDCETPSPPHPQA